MQLGIILIYIQRLILPVNIMYICICSAVTERQIHQAVKAGATSMQDLRNTLNITADCGRCAPCARKCLREAQQCNSKTPPTFVDDLIAA
jgi:bacterioferritin-associated ferredoxin